MSKGTTPELPVIDLVLGAKLLGGDDLEQAKFMITELVKVLPDDLEKISVAFKARDFKQLQDLVHYVKGGVSFCGTPRLKQAISVFENSINTSADFEVINTAYKNFCKEVDALLAAYTP